ncbi:MAG: putative permease [Gammaproteobacteria bacterium]|nr:MAG: putative permease [Gammaproteobacteria bacterium]TND02609.1 MAG: putative permease [Gammaproteobacteria bacterium]
MTPLSTFVPVIALLISSTMWGVMWYPLRLLENAGLQGLWSSLILYCAALLAGLPMLWRHRVESRHLGQYAVLALASGWCNVAFILAVIDGNVVRVLLLFYLSPLWTVLFARLILHEPMAREAKATLVLAMVGAVIMLWNPAVGLPWPQDPADWLAISSGAAFALSNVIARKVQGVSIWTKAAVAWTGVIGVAIALLAITTPPLPQVDGTVYLSAFALGAIGMLVMTMAVLYGVTHMPAHRSAVILLFELVAGSVSAQLLTDELVQLNEWIGGALIVSAALFAARSHTRDGC